MEGACTWGRMPRHKSLIKGSSGKGKSQRFMKKAEIKWLMLWIWVCVASGEHTHPHILQLNSLLRSRVIFKRTKHLIFLAIVCNESPGLISITSAYHWSQRHRRWAKFIPWLALLISHFSVWTLRGERGIIPGSYVILTFFSFFLVHGLFFFFPWIGLDFRWSRFKPLFSPCCHESTLLLLHFKCEESFFALNMEMQLQKAL